MKHIVPLYITARTGTNVLAYWAEPVPAKDGSEPLLLLRLSSFIEMLYGAHLHEVAQLVCTIVEVTRTQLYIMQEGQFKTISPENEPEGKVPYHELLFPSGDMILLMLQMHYFHMATKIQLTAAQTGGKSSHTDRKLLMTREQVIAKAKRQYTSENAYDLLYKLDMLEQHTTQLLHYIAPPESLPADRSSDHNRKYVRTSCHLIAMLTTHHLLYMNMISVTDAGRLTKPLATTFLAALAEGYYVYHAHPEKRLSQTSVQYEASRRWITVQKGKPKIMLPDHKIKLASTPTPAPEATPEPAPLPAPPKAQPVQKPKPAPAPASAPAPRGRTKTAAKQKRSKDVEMIKAIQRAKAADFLEKARVAEAEKKAMIKAAATRAVSIIEAKGHVKVPAPAQYVDEEPHMWCTWSDCLCHILRCQMI